MKGMTAVRFQVLVPSQATFIGTKHQVQARLAAHNESMIDASSDW